MTFSRRLFKIIAGLIMLICGVLMISFPQDGYFLVVTILDISLLFYGVKSILYYFTMARFMVGGIVSLYKGIIFIDLGLFVFSMDDLPKKTIMMYLVGCLAFDGVVNVLQAMERKRIGSGSWKYEFFYGIIKVLLALISLLFLNSVEMMTYIYCAGLIHSAISNIVSAFRKTAIVYVDG